MLHGTLPARRHAQRHSPRITPTCRHMLRLAAHNVLQYWTAQLAAQTSGRRWYDSKSAVQSRPRPSWTSQLPAGWASTKAVRS